MPRTVLVNYFVQTRSKIVTGAFDLDLPEDEAVTLPAIRQSFPYGGVYHFRAKVSSSVVPELGKVKYGWLDITSDSQALPAVAPGVVVVKVLPLFDFGDGRDVVERNPDVGFPMTPQQHLDWMVLRAHEARGTSVPPSAAAPPSAGAGSAASTGRRSSASAAFPLPDALASGKGSVRPVGAGDGTVSSKLKDTLGSITRRISTSDTLKSIKSKGGLFSRSVGKFFSDKAAAVSRAVSAVGATVAGATEPSEDTLVTLQALQLELRTAFVPGSSEHESLLEELWAAVFPTKPYVRVSPQWQAMGFQGDDPTTDLRGVGILGLRCLVCFARTNMEQLQAMVARHRTAAATSYPVAVAGINIANVLVQLMHLRQPQDELAATKTVFWELLSDGTNFFDAFCVSFAAFDALWTGTGASREVFGDAVAELQAALKAALHKAPKTVEEFAAGIQC